MGYDPDPGLSIDMHFHVGLLGDRYPKWGRLSEWYRRQLVYKIFLLYAGLEPDRVSDRTLREATERTIAGAIVDRVVCLALDPVYDIHGGRREDRSHVWVDNEYVLDLRRTIGKKVLLGASVHPYDPSFERRVTKCVGEGAVLLKWLPSAQQIDLADPRVLDRLRFLATAKDGKALPLLLHVGPEYAIPSIDERTKSYDFLSWTIWDRIGNAFRGKGKWIQPRTKELRDNLRDGLDDGATIIFAHCGLPYFAPRLFRYLLEHSDLKEVREYLKDYPESSTYGRCYADVSACVTPFRRTYFNDIRKLPPSSLLFGSDFPTPVFELSADLGEMIKDLKAVLNGQLERVVIPQDNLLNVNYRELLHFFPGHAMFSNFNRLL